MTQRSFTVYFPDEGKLFVKIDDYNVYGEQVIIQDDNDDAIENYKELTKTYHAKWLKEQENESSNQEQK